MLYVTTQQTRLVHILSEDINNQTNVFMRLNKIIKTKL